MNVRHPIPDLWLLSDARNDGGLEDALARLPRGSGFVFRHYHMEAQDRAARFEKLGDVARAHGHRVLLSADPSLARAWGADGVYGAMDRIGEVTVGPDTLLRFATAHNAREIAVANAARADAVFVSPVFPTRSHPGGAVLGSEGFHMLARLANMPVIALGGMTFERARELEWTRWGAIDGLG